MSVIFFRHPDINSAAEEISGFHDLDLIKLKIALLEQWLPEKV